MGESQEPRRGDSSTAASRQSFFMDESARSRRTMSVCSQDSSALWETRSENQRAYEDWKHCKWGEDKFDLVELDAEDLDFDLFGEVELPSRGQVIGRLKSMLNDSFNATGVGIKLLTRHLKSRARSPRHTQTLETVSEETDTSWAMKASAWLSWCTSPWRAPVIVNIFRALSCPRRRSCPRRKKLS
ncbi:MAG: uncharacterized protein KVP18_002228 [Porospora cf. gigantea A]|uniref:uncharacterized protein n=2 Tax=Porospora cf. gigantea A TaxID=2853593 RepID=UPI0035594A0C|nr:MAG: hypothetical protein KVP18_002228 [Porospora cf. gigantea A]